MYIVSIYNVCILFSSIHLLSLIMMRDDIHNNKNDDELEEQKQKRDASCFNFKYTVLYIYIIERYHVQNIITYKIYTILH